MKHLRRERATRLRLKRSEQGATATEYGLLVGFIAMAIVFGVGAFGTALLTLFNGFAAWLAVTI